MKRFRISPLTTPHRNLNVKHIARDYKVSRIIAHSRLHPSLTPPLQYAVFFTGESSIYSMRPTSAPLAKETVWALFERSFLLWNATILMVMRTRSPLTRMSDVEKAHFAISVNQEADAIEAALRGHGCEIERAFLFHSRDYLFRWVFYHGCERKEVGRRWGGKGGRGVVQGNMMLKLALQRKDVRGV